MVNGKVSRLALFLLFCTAFIGIAFAQSATSASGASKVASALAPFLNGALGTINCKTNYTITVINNVISDIPSLSTLSSYSATLTQQTVQLQTYANSGNVSSFKSYVLGTYDPELKTINTAIRIGVKSANVSASVISTIKSQQAAAKLVAQGCDFSAVKGAASTKIALLQSGIGAYQSKAAQVGKRGIDNSSLNTLISTDTAQTIVPLQNALSSATNATQVYSALSSYCLYSGCKSGLNNHLAAQFTLQLFNLIAAKGLTMNNTNHALIAQAQQNLTAAAATLSQVGTSDYGNGQANIILNNLKGAGTELRSAFAGTAKGS